VLVLRRRLLAERLLVPRAPARRERLLADRRLLPELRLLLPLLRPLLRLERLLERLLDLLAAIFVSPILSCGVYVEPSRPFVELLKVRLRWLACDS